MKSRGSQPYVRLVVRGKAKAPSEFCATLHLSIDETGFGRIEYLLFNVFNEVDQTQFNCRIRTLWCSDGGATEHRGRKKLLRGK